MPSGSEKKLEEISWATVITVTIILAIVESVATLLTASSPIKMRYMWGIQGGSTLLPFNAIFLPSIVYVLFRLFKRQPSALYLAYLFTIGMMVSHAIPHGWMEQYPTLFAAFRAVDTYNVLDVWWIPPKSVCVSLIAGGTSINWAEWVPSIVYWTVHFTIIYFLFSSIVIIFRRLWVDVERIPFPVVVAGYSIIRALAPEAGEEKNLRTFMIGVVIALIVEMPIILAYILPWFPDIYGFRTSTCACGGVHIIQPGTLTESVAALAMLNKNPLTFALFLLAPLSVLFNIWFWYLVLVVLVQIAYYMGYYTGILTETHGCGRVMFCSVNLATSPPFRWDWLTGVGGIIGFILLFLFNNRSYIAETVKAALGKASKLSEYEKTEPLRYRTAYIMFIVFSILAVMMLVAAGINVGSAIAIVFPIGIINYFIGVLTLGYTGFSQSWTWTQKSGWALSFVYPEIQKAYSTDWTLSYYFAYILGSNSQGWNVGTEGPAYAFAMANYAKAASRRMYILATVSFILALPITMIIPIWLSSTYGLTRLGIARCELATHSCAGEFGYIGMFPKIPDMLQYIFAGALVTAIISILRARFVWFPFEPIGFIIGTSAAGMYLGIWTAALGAWIIKTIILRIGGSKLYERIVPVIGGYLAGYVLSSFIATVIGIVRFFIPF
jgi:hypothetical protein